MSITKNALVERDQDLLGPMAARGLAHVNVRVTTLDPVLSRATEPRATTPAARLKAIQTLSTVGVPVRVLVVGRATSRCAVGMPFGSSNCHPLGRPSVGSG